MLSTPNMSRSLLICIISTFYGLSFSQNATFISPYKDHTSFIYNIVDSNKTVIGETAYHLRTIHNSPLGTIIQVSKNRKGIVTDSSSFSITSDSTGFTLNSNFFLTPKQRAGIISVHYKKRAIPIRYDGAFTPDTLNNLNFKYVYDLNNAELGTASIKLTNRYIGGTSSIETGIGNKSCYKVSTTRTEEFLFKKTVTEIVDWYSSQGLMKREFYENGKLTYAYVLKKVNE